MKHIKRTLSVLITLAMLICLIPAGLVSATMNNKLLKDYNYNFQQDGDTYLITNEEDWEALAAAVMEGYLCEDETFRQTADISVSTPMGGLYNNRDRRYFCGHYNGDGYTLTVTLDANDDPFVNNNGGKSASSYCSPFPYVGNATIENLRVEGTITSTKKYSAGLIGSTLGNCTISHISVGVTIYSNRDSDSVHDGTHGGIIAIAEYKYLAEDASKNYVKEVENKTGLHVYVENCTFDGSFIDTGNQHTTGCGGIVGYAKANVHLTDCVFNPSRLDFSSGNNASTFSRLASGTATYDDCYYTDSLGSVPNSDEVVKVETDLPDDGATYEVVSVNGLTLYAPVTGSSVPQFEGYSLRVSGDIGLVFYATIPEEIRSDCYMTFAISGKGTVSGDQIAIDPNMINGSYYGFVCNINALQMADTITATLHTSDGKAYSNSHTVAEYISTIVTGDFGENTKSFAKALADYGHYIQLFQAETRNFSIGSDYAEIDTYGTINATAISEAESAVSSYLINKPAENTNGIAKVSFSVGFDSDTSIYVYFTPASDYTGTISAGVTSGTMETLTNKSGKKYYLKISNVGATQFAKAYDVDFEADGTGTVGNVSVLAYAHALFENSASYTYADEAAAAIYNYYTAALAYVG